MRVGFSDRLPGGETTETYPPRSPSAVAGCPRNAEAMSRWNGGVANAASTVAFTIPPNTPAPLARAGDVMTMGRKRTVRASKAASRSERPSAARACATVMIRMAFSAVGPMTVMSPKPWFATPPQLRFELSSERRRQAWATQPLKANPA